MPNALESTTLIRHRNRSSGQYSVTTIVTGVLFHLEMLLGRRPRRQGFVG